MANFVIRKSSDNQYYFYLRANNSQIVVTSETYTRKQSALDGIAVVKREAPSASILDMTEE